MNQNVKIEYDQNIAIIIIDNPPVNVLSKQVRLGLQSAVNKLAENPKLEAAVLICSGNTFVAGADINEFDTGDFEPEVNDVFRNLENLSIPVVCAIHGSALGGGFELALSCHYRCATVNAKVGLPEVGLGLLPGAGGTQRLPRLIGIKNALDVIISGKPISAQRAYELGAIDWLVEGDLKSSAVFYARQLIESQAPLRRTSEQVIPQAAEAVTFLNQYRQGVAKKVKGRIAPLRIIDSVEAAVSEPFETGLKRERELFVECMQSSQSAALRHLFFAERQTSKIPGLSHSVKPRPIERVAVVGVGTMGVGIAMSFANAGIPVTLLDMDESGLKRGMEGIAKNYNASVKSGRILQPICDQRIELIRGTCDYEDLADSDLVIEAVFEDMEVKKEVFRKLDTVCRSNAILASNTSTLNIDEIAAVTERAEDVLGLHFFSPANIMKLLEIVRADKTSDEALVTALTLAKKLRKIGVVSGVCYGFIGNRMLEGYIREAGFLLLEGASPQQVDQAVTDFGMAMGPFAMGDMAGLDLNAKVLKERRAKGELPDDERYGLVINKLVEAGRYGQKTGKGFYRYPGGSRIGVPDPEVDTLIALESSRLGIQRRDISNEEIVQRCIYPLILEGARILDEGIALRAGDIDIVWVYGYGFPAHLGGPLHYADSIGVKEFYQSIVGLAETQPGQYWEPTTSIEKLAECNGRFSDISISAEDLS